MEDKKNLVTQPVWLERKKKVRILRYRKTNPDIIGKIPHLTEIYRYYQDIMPATDRIILQAPDQYTVWQAAAAVVNLRNIDSFSRDNTEDEWTVPVFDENWLPVDDAQWALYSTDDLSLMENDCLVIKAEDLAADNEQDIEAAALVHIMGESDNELQKKLLDVTNYVLIECGDSFDEETFFDEVAGLCCKNIILSMPQPVFRQRLVERLAFELDFKLLRVSKPEDSYYEGLFQKYAKHCEYILSEKCNIPVLMEKLKSFRGSYFSENDIFRYLDNANANCTGRGENVLCPEDFRLFRVEEPEPAAKKLSAMIGLESVKDQIQKVCAVRIVQEKLGTEKMKQGSLHNNLVFSGCPGTGKSEVAKLYARILAENHVITGSFVKADRSSMIGKYVGHTAPKIKRLFDMADGGVLFIDEAGTLLLDDEYTKEAITELVRFMEERPQTTVIFATYPDKTQEFLDVDPGIRSRISRVIDFPSYSDKELVSIFSHMVQESGWEMTHLDTHMIEQYAARLKQLRGDHFGNAREMRKLLEAAIECSCYRILKSSGRKDEKCVILEADLRDAMKGVLGEKVSTKRIGFQLE